MLSAVFAWPCHPNFSVCSALRAGAVTLSSIPACDGKQSHAEPLQHALSLTIPGANSPGGYVRLRCGHGAGAEPGLSIPSARRVPGLCPCHSLWVCKCL